MRHCQSTVEAPFKCYFVNVVIGVSFPWMTFPSEERGRVRFEEEAKISEKGLQIGDDGIAEKNDAGASEQARPRKKVTCY